jgi:peroxiredoxin
MAEPQDFPLPANLPAPLDDGGASHLKGITLPKIALRSTAGGFVDLSQAGALRTVVFCYPMTGVPGKALPDGWDLIPGARGCTPQTCEFRDRFNEFSSLGASVYGLSTQTTEYQTEMARRLKLPFAVLSDAQYEFCGALQLPMFEVEGVRLLKRLTLILRAGKIEEVFYPVFPPNESAEQTLGWLRQNPA